MRESNGAAGESFVKHVQEIPDAELIKRHKDICQKISILAQSTGKQIQALVCVLLADELARECLFPGEPLMEPLMDPLKILGGQKREDEISQSERAYQFLVDWLAMSENLFNNPEYSIKILGKIDKESCLFIQTELQRMLKENRFNFNAVKKDWAGYLERSKDGRFAFLTTVGSKDTKARYVKIVLPQGFIIEALEDYKGVGNPFVAKD